MGRTNVVLDDTLVERCLEATGFRTRRALIDHALRELLRHKRQRKILELKRAGGLDREAAALGGSGAFMALLEERSRESEDIPLNAVREKRRQ